MKKWENQKKNGNIKKDKLKNVFESQYIFLIEKKNSCPMGSISRLDASHQSLVLRFLSAVILLCLLTCPFRALD
jgi:hypothetical protein